MHTLNFCKHSQNADNSVGCHGLLLVTMETYHLLNAIARHPPYRGCGNTVV